MSAEEVPGMDRDATSQPSLLHDTDRLVRRDLLLLRLDAARRKRRGATGMTVLRKANSGHPSERLTRSTR